LKEKKIVPERRKAEQTEGGASSHCRKEGSLDKAFTLIEGHPDLAKPQSGDRAPTGSRESISGKSRDPRAKAARGAPGNTYTPIALKDGRADSR
jgi:hypothetical protein